MLHSLKKQKLRCPLLSRNHKLHSPSCSGSPLQFSCTTIRVLPSSHRLWPTFTLNVLHQRTLLRNSSVIIRINSLDKLLPFINKAPQSFPIKSFIVKAFPIKST